MFLIPHMVAGAAIARRVRWPWLALVLAFASHFVFDIIPHLDVHSMFGNFSGTPTTLEVITAIIDFLLGIAIVVWVTRGQPRRRILLTGALCGIIVDLVDNVPPWNAWFHTLPGALWFSGIHHGIQHNVGFDQWLLGLGTQLAVLLVSLALLIPMWNNISAVQSDVES